MALRARLAGLAQFYAKIVAFWLIIAAMLAMATAQTLAHVARQAWGLLRPARPDPEAEP